MQTPTRNLSLNQWELTDKPRMEEFNADNRMIDAAVGRLNTEKPTVTAGGWKPELIGSITEGSVTYTGQTGRYYRIGNLVYVWAWLKIASITGLSGNVQVRGIPFTTAQIAALTLGYSALFTKVPTITTMQNINAVELFEAGTTVRLSEASLKSGGYFDFSGVYCI